MFVFVVSKQAKRLLQFSSEYLQHDTYVGLLVDSGL